MIPMKKTLAVIIISALLIGTGYVMVAAYNSGNGFEDGVPVPTVAVKLTDATGDQQTIIIDPSQATTFTAVTSTLYAVNPADIYNIEFIVGYEVTPPPEIPADTILEGYATMSGRRFDGVTDYYFHNSVVGIPALGQPAVVTEATILNDYQGTAAFTGTDKMFDKARLADPLIPITGSLLDGSTWTLTIVTKTLYAGTGAYQGTYTLDITMELGGDNLIVTAGDVDVTLTTP